MIVNENVWLYLPQSRTFSHSSRLIKLEQLQNCNTIYKWESDPRQGSRRLLRSIKEASAALPWRRRHLDTLKPPNDSSTPLFPLCKQPPRCIVALKHSIYLKGSPLKSFPRITAAQMILSIYLRIKKILCQTLFDTIDNWRDSFKILTKQWFAFMQLKGYNMKYVLVLKINSNT